MPNSIPKYCTLHLSVSSKDHKNNGNNLYQEVALIYNCRD